MTFLSTMFLAALPLALAPLLLHLFDRRRNVTIEWGAMDFLLEASTRRTHARKLQQWLLLLLRVLAVASLILALARPLLPGHWLGVSERGETILVLDNSLSTQRTSEQTSVFETLVRRAVEELDAIPSGDDVRVLLASPYPVWAVSESVRLEGGNRTDLAEQLSALRPTTGSSDLLAALFTAVQAETDPATQRRRVIVFTDGQANDWKMTDRSGWARFQEVLKTAEIPAQLKIVEESAVSTRTANLSVDRLQSTRLVTGVDQPLTLTATVQNHSVVESAACQLTWLVDSQPIRTEDLPALPSAATRDVILLHEFSRPGVYSVTCSIQAEDVLPTDNQATVVIEVTEEIPVLIVDAAAGQAELQQDAFFVQAAMGWIDAAGEGQRGVFRPTVVSPELLQDLPLDDYQAVVFPNFTALSETAVQTLTAYADSGGGVWIALGPRTDVEMFNQYLYAAGEGLSPVAVEDMVSTAVGDSILTLDPPQREHPATQVLARNDRVDTREVRVRRRFRFAPSGTGQNPSVLLKLSNGEPLAVENSAGPGQGRVVVLGIPLTLRDWSELVRSQAFVVMVHEWLTWLTQPQATRHNLMPGDPISVHLSETEHREAFLQTPHGDQVQLTADPVADGVIFRSGRTILPGDYRLQLGLTGDVIPFHVQRSVRESNLTEMSSEERQLLAHTAGLVAESKQGGYRSEVPRNPIWPLLLMLLIAVMSVELLLAGMISRERFGADRISETSEHSGASGLWLPRNPVGVVSLNPQTPATALSDSGTSPVRSGLSESAGHRTATAVTASRGSGGPA